MADKDTQALTPLEQQEVVFYGDELTAVRASDGRVYASLRHMCQALDIDMTGQRQRVQRHKVLEGGLMVCKIQTIQGERDTYVLRVDLVPLWLTGIRTNMVKEEVRPKLERFQQEAATVLWEAFQEGRLTVDPAFSDLLDGADPHAVEAYQIAKAVMKLAQSQIQIEARLTGRLDVQQGQIDLLDKRLEEIETTLGQPDHHINPAQASRVSQAVKAVAFELGKVSGRNEYGGVYGELYRKFEITSYKELPAKKYEAAMKWLTEWYMSLTDKEAPF